MPDAGEVQRDTGGLGRGDDQVIADRAARLGHRAHAGLGQDLKAVREGKIRVARGDRPGRPLPRAQHRQAGRVHPVDLAHADADRGPAGGEQDGVRLDRAAGLPREREICQLRSVDRRARLELPVRRIVPRLVDPVQRQAFFDEDIKTQRWTIKPEVKSLVTWKQHNLLFPLKDDPFNCIFIKNVLIYFDKESKEAVVKNLIAALAEGGYLVVGPTEGIYAMLDPLSKLKPWLYQKPG